jgi:DNA processing protein
MIDPLSARVMKRGAKGWPEQFEHLKTPPRALWMVGRDMPRWPAVAIVGSRRPTAVGREIARDAARALAVRGVQVISGFARGIDEAAHRGALEGGGSTVAVLGCGLSVRYPMGHDGLRWEIARSGLLMTEDEATVQPETWRFPRRNRLIAALSAAVIVVEATERSGALSTARWAADLGREVLAVPGSIRSDRSDGTNLLIRDGARPYLQVRDVFDAVPELWRLASLGIPEPTRTADPAETDQLPWARQILELIGAEPIHPDRLASELDVSAPALAAQLMQLELAGAIRTDVAGTVTRVF